MSKEFKEFLKEGKIKANGRTIGFTDTTADKTPQEEIPSNITLSQNVWDAGYNDAVAAISQGAGTDQVLFTADKYDQREFGKGLSKVEVLARISSPLSKPDSKFNRPIVKINIKTGKIAHINQEKYEAGKIAWERPLKFKFLTIKYTMRGYFKIW